MGVDSEDTSAALRLGIPRRSYLPPSVRLEMVARDTLVKRLLDARPDQLVVMTAPAGYGKTTTLALWLQANERPSAWVHLGALDNDPVHLLRHVALAIDRVAPLDERVVRILSGAGSDPDIDILPAVVAAIEQCPPCTLVLDDIHTVSADRSLQTVRDLVSARPPHCMIALAGRGTPPLNLSRHVMNDGVVGVSAYDLAMNEDEAMQLFRRVGLELGADRVAEMTRRTEGWPGGLHLAALALARGADRAGRPVLSDHDRLVVDYMVEEVLETQCPDMVEFLERSALLDTMSAPVLDDLLDRDDSARMLEEIERSGNLFLVPLDETRASYRYHALFGGVLRARLRRRDPDVAQEIDRRASGMLEASGDVDGALRHAVAAGDTGRGADLILARAFGLINVGRVALLGHWLGLIGADAMHHHPAAAVAWAWYGLAMGNVALIERATAAASPFGSDGPMADGSPSVEVAVATLRAVAARGGVAGVIRDTQIVRDAGDASSNPWWGLASVLQGTAHAMLGELELARARYLEAHPVISGTPGTEATVLAHLATLALHDDDLPEADRLSSRASSITERYNLNHVVPTLPVYPVSALVAAKCGRADEGRRHAATAREMLARLGDLSPRSALLAHLQLAQAALALGDRPQARESATEAERARRREPTATFLNEQLDEVRAVLARGDDGAALVAPITTAELRVLTYLPTHLSLQEIADRLTISRHTAKSHSISIYRKLGVSSRSDAVTEARGLGILAT